MKLTLHEQVVWIKVCLAYFKGGNGDAYFAAQKADSIINALRTRS